MKSVLAIDLKEAQKVANASDKTILEKALDALLRPSYDNRNVFSRVSEQVVELYKRSGSHSLDLYYCPMAKGYAYWLQPKGEPIGNPYMGSKMVSCGAKI